jgi:hypothetical protein
MDVKKQRAELEPLLKDISKRGREFNINLVVGSQRPNGDVISLATLGMMSKVCMKVEEPAYSKYLIKTEDGATLKGKGELLFRHDGILTKCQGFHITNEDMKEFGCTTVDHTAITSRVVEPIDIFTDTTDSTDTKGILLPFERPDSYRHSDTDTDKFTDKPCPTRTDTMSVMSADTTDTTDRFSDTDTDTDKSDRFSDSATDTLEDEIIKLKRADTPIRKIAEKLNIKKYYVEKVIKERLG